MAKYDWATLKQEYLFGDYSNLSEFASFKGIARNGNFNKRTVGWIEEKAKLGQKNGKEISENVQKSLIESETARHIQRLEAYDIIFKKVMMAVSSIGEPEASDLKYLDSAAKIIRNIHDGCDLDEGRQSFEDKRELNNLFEILKESDDGATFSPVLDPLVLLYSIDKFAHVSQPGGTAAVTVLEGDSANIGIDLIGCKRYVQITVTGASGLALALGDPGREPF